MAYPRFTYSFFRYEYTELCALSIFDEPFLEYFLVLIIPVSFDSSQLSPISSDVQLSDPNLNRKFLTVTE